MRITTSKLPFLLILCTPLAAQMPLEGESTTPIVTSAQAVQEEEEEEVDEDAPPGR